MALLHVSVVRIMCAMEYTIRHITKQEWPLLEDFLYEAIFVPEDFTGVVPREVICNDPKCRAAYEGFGTLPDDRALVAEVGGKVVGACWVRTTDEYGHIDDHTPSFSIALLKSQRGHGIGGAMMRRMLDELRDAGYDRASLSVQKRNPALRLYERLGFRVIGDGADASEWLMVCRLSSQLPLAVRRAETEDIPTLVSTRIAQLREEGALQTCDIRPELHKYYARHLQDGSFFGWLAQCGDDVVATSGISVVEKPPYFGCPSGRIGLVSGMYTQPEYRRQGIARDLLCRVLDDAKRKGCGVAQITASNAGVPLYRSVGFAHNANFLQLPL